MLFPGATPLSCHSRGGMKVRRLGLHPFHKGCDLGISTKAIDIGKALGQFGFREPGVNGAMADLMEAHRSLMRAPLQPWRQVVAAGSGFRGYRTAAERADLGCALRSRSLRGGDRLVDPPR